MAEAHGHTAGTDLVKLVKLCHYLLHWMPEFAVDGIRMDSVNNIANWDFVQEFKDLARTTWQQPPNALNGVAEYRVPNWPATPAGRKWREITQARDVPAEWVAREPIFAWEAKVYAVVDA